jgi:dCMP deaminase
LKFLLPHDGFPLKKKEKKKKHPLRPSWEEYFMDITHLVAKRSTCLRRHVGAVLVKDKKILATGYNGSPSGLEHCLDIGCLREKLSIPSGERHELCRGLHAEQNAIIQAAYHGVQIRGATLYCTNHPCIICSKMIINAGIQRIIYEEGYADALAKQMLKESKVKVEKFDRKYSSEIGL